MPHTTQTSDFWGWYLRHNARTIWKNLYDAGMDLFSVGPSNDPQSFLDLTNVLPAMSGGFKRRWGITSFHSAVGYSSSYAGTVRCFFYNNPQDASDPSNTANTNLWIFSNNSGMLSLKDDGSLFTGFAPSGLSAASEMSAVTSRGWLYFANGSANAGKCNPSYTTSDTNSNMGIDLPLVSPSVGVYDDRPGVYGSGEPGNLSVLNTTLRSGWGYSSAPTITITDTDGGTGTGATATCSIDANGSIQTVTITNPGTTAYTRAQATLSGGGTPTRPGGIVLYTQTNPSAPNYGKVVGFDLAGQMSFVGGRQYAVALRNSKTGHTSDTYIQSSHTPIFAFGSTHPNFDLLTKGYNSVAGVDTNFPVFATSTNVVAGGTQIALTVFVGSTGLDPQVDTVLLMAGADGQGLSTLYELAQIPLASFTLTAGNTYEYRYIDTIPDTFTDAYVVGDTLLASNIWAETNSDGTTSGIFLNTPPPSPIKYLTLHQGRLFGTDGKSVFFSKSIDEVTTSSSLITSKWEEAWPGDYVLPVALGNEEINSIKSDGVTLHLGTEKNIFTLYGSDPTTFSIPNQAFAQTGVLRDDCWSVVYQEGQPSGFVWLTPDFKVMHSDFSTYRDIGTPILPILQNIDPTRADNCKVLSMTLGAYNFVILAVYLTTSTNAFQPDYYIYETRLGKWYHWTLPSTMSAPPQFGITLKVPISFVYQFPTFTSSTETPGSRYLFVGQVAQAIFPSPSNITIYNFKPTATQDFGTTNIDWSIQTTWQDLADPTAIKVVNELDITGTDGPYNVTLYTANKQADFSSPYSVSGTTITGPISRMGTNKLFVAGQNTSGKFYSVKIAPSSPGTSTDVLTEFSLESYPIARI